MDKPIRQIAWLTGLVYFTQGALGVSGIALPIFLRSLDWSVGKITAVSSVVAFPWIFKVIYGFVSDSFPILGYRRKSYLVIFSLCSSLGWILLVILPPETAYIGIALTLSNLGFAATDVVTDGLVVEHSRGPLSSFFQSISWGTRSAGALIAGFLGGWMAANWPPYSVFLVTALLPVPVAAFAFLIKEVRYGQPTTFGSLYEPLRRCFQLIRIPSIRWFILVLITLSVSSTFGVPFFFFMKETLGFKETFLGVLASLGWGGAVIGSVLYFRILRKVSQQKVLIAAVIINSLNIFSALFIREPETAMILIFIGGIMSCISLLTIMTASALLTHRSGVEGTFFAILMGIFNLGQILFGFVGGKLYTVIGLRSLIVLSGMASFVGILFIRKIVFQSAGSVLRES